MKRFPMATLDLALEIPGRRCCKLFAREQVAMLFQTNKHGEPLQLIWVIRFYHFFVGPCGMSDPASSFTSTGVWQFELATSKPLEVVLVEEPCAKSGKTTCSLAFF